MPIRSICADQMVAQVIRSLEIQRDRTRPVFSLVLGAGFSAPVIPTAGQMLTSDFAWWLYRQQCGGQDPFTERPPNHRELAVFEQRLWADVKQEMSTIELDSSGLPNLALGENVGNAYQAIMGGCAGIGFYTPDLRRRFLRDVVGRAAQRINSAHLYLAAILQAQQSWVYSPFCRTIFTTNFDPLLQLSLQLVNQLYYMTDRPDVLEAPEDDDGTAIHLVYTHGSVHRYLLLNTEDEIDTSRNNNAVGLAPYFRKHGVIVIGYSGWNDTVMAALRQCSQFDWNLYWCDRASPEEAQTKLRPEVRSLLAKPSTFYVQIRRADDLLRQLHRALGLGTAPRFILSPIDQLMEQLGKISVSQPRAPRTTHGSPDAELADTLEDILSRTLTQLGSLKKMLGGSLAGDGAAAGIAPTGSPEASAALLNGAVEAFATGKLDEAIRLWSAAIDTQTLPPAQRALALYNRGMAFGQRREIDREIRDYTAVIDMPDAPSEQRASCLLNRGVVYGQKGQTDRELQDYSAAIEFAGTPANLRAQALINRAITYGELKDASREAQDYDRVINMADAPKDLLAQALLNRGMIHVARQETDDAVQDFTRLLDISEAPSDVRAKALLHRGVLRGRSEDTTGELADYTAVIHMNDAPVEERARSLLNRGITRREQGDVNGAAADCSAVIGMGDAPPEDRAVATLERAGIYADRREAEKALADYSAVIGMAPPASEERARALLGRGILLRKSGEFERGIAELTAAIGAGTLHGEDVARAHAERGFAFRKEGRLDEAVADYSKVIDSTEAPLALKARALGRRGWASYLRGDVNGLIADSRQSLEIDPNRLDFRFNLALGLLITSQIDEAKARYADAAKLCDDAKRIRRLGISDLAQLLRRQPGLSGAGGGDILQMLEARERELDSIGGGG
jgi:tetratricopeptide (TPR) repeat protein